MSDRKYRQRGYQDEPRERTPRPSQKPEPQAPRERGPREPRAPNMPGFREVMRCARCGNVITTPSAIVADTRCNRCGADLRACVNCVSFDTGSRWECSQTIPARIAQKDTRNECTLFQTRTTVERETGSTAPTSARRAFDDLFK